MQDTGETLQGPQIGLQSLRAPCTLHSTSKHDRTHDAECSYEPSRPCRHEPRGCDLNSVNEIEITPREAVFDDEGNRLLPSRGRGEGVRPHDTAPGRGVLGLAPTFPQEINAMELSTNPAPALSAPAAGPPFYR